MELQTRGIYEAALKLCDPERETLVELLILSVDYGDPNEIAAEWEVELERRLQQVLAGEVEEVPWSEVKEGPVQ